MKNELLTYLDDCVVSILEHICSLRDEGNISEMTADILMQELLNPQDEYDPDTLAIFDSLYNKYVA